MGKKCSSLLPHVLGLLLMLCIFPAPFSVTGLVLQTEKTELPNENSPGRILYQLAKPATFEVQVRGFEEKGQERTHSLNSEKKSRSVEKTHQSEGRRLLGLYFPNVGKADPSKSRQGGGRNPEAAP
ncbi:PREDICTED: uncharacterized protein LOC104760474 [Camelina sativa]|uniref:Uncharacterized protein LOC104760474 n=1 Tax=Camelina sativa TaxID=90675 RepID=A0ABM0X727_CAMSA|nr:PREDICTED: uncharacterized protein LOC104760474 [Camelina sativa]